MKKQTHLSIPSLLFPCSTPFFLKQSPLRLSSPSIATTASNACSQPSPPPFPPPPSIIIVIVMIIIIIIICHAAASNALLLPPPPPRCRCISKRAAATAKIALPPSCCLCCQAGRRHCAPATATSANARQPPRYTAYKMNKKGILLTNLFFTTMVMTARSNDCGTTRQQRWQCCFLQLPRIALMLRSDKCEASNHIENKKEMTEHTDTLKILIIQLLLELY
jgi:hypothetical protein